MSDNHETLKKEPTDDTPLEMVSKTPVAPLITPVTTPAMLNKSLFLRSKATLLDPELASSSCSKRRKRFFSKTKEKTFVGLLTERLIGCSVTSNQKQDGKEEDVLHFEKLQDPHLVPLDNGAVIFKRFEDIAFLISKFCVDV